MKWIYRYWRADYQWIDMGLYDSEGEAAGHMNNHSSFGARTRGPFAVTDDYELFNKEPGEP